jgi:hypothetical protein
VTARRGETVSPLPEVKAKIAMVLLDENEDTVVKALIKKIAKGAKIDFKNPPTESASKGEPAASEPVQGDSEPVQGEQPQ